MTESGSVPGGQSVSLARLRPSRRERHRVTIFGSAGTRPGDVACQEAKRGATRASCRPPTRAPGGIGTVLESMMVWQLLQVRHLEKTPLIVVGRMWPGLVEWARIASAGLANQEHDEEMFHES